MERSKRGTTRLPGTQPSANTEAGDNTVALLEVGLVF
jgi:hypothetical protein